MPTMKDPEGIELRYLQDIADLTNAHVLEIGCGDGRLTWHYAASAGRVTATDPDSVRLTAAQTGLPPELRSKLAFVQTRAETLPFPNETFEVAIFAWSL